MHLFLALLQLNGGFGKELHPTSEAAKQVSHLQPAHKFFGHYWPVDFSLWIQKT